MQNIPSIVEIDSLIRRIKHIIGTEVVNEVKRQSLQKKHGKTYIYQGRKHIASANDSSEGFANRSGRLRNSITYRVRNEIQIGSDIPYLKYLEGGTSRMNPRPSLDLGVRKTDIDTLIKRELDNFFR